MICQICKKEFMTFGYGNHRAACQRKQAKERQALVDRFNGQFKVGDPVMWRIDPYSEYRMLILSHQAELSSGQPVAWFGGPYCSIDPMFIKYD